MKFDNEFNRKIRKFLKISPDQLKENELEELQEMIQEMLHFRDELDERNKRFISILEHIPDHILLLDRDLKIEYANYASPGLTVDELIGIPLDTYVEIERQDEIKSILEGVFKTGTPAHYFTTYNKPDGKCIYYESAVAPRFVDDKIEGLTLIARDITERLETEKALRESEEKLSNIINHSSELYYIHDSSHNITYISPQCRNIFGYTEEEMMVKWTTLATDHPVNVEGIEKTMKAIITGKKQPNYLLELKHRNGSHLWVEVDESPLKDESGKVVGIVGALREITEKKNAEDELNVHRENLEKLVKERTKELEGKNKKLEEFNQLFVGREFRIKELKDQLKEIKEKLEKYEDV